MEYKTGTFKAIMQKVKSNEIMPVNSTDVFFIF